MEPKYNIEMDNSDSSTDSEIDDETLVEGNEGPELVTAPPNLVQKFQDNDDDDDYDMDDGDEEEEGETRTSINHSMKVKRQLHKEKFASWLVSVFFPYYRYRGLSYDCIQVRKSKK